MRGGWQARLAYDVLELAGGRVTLSEWTELDGRGSFFFSLGKKKKKDKIKSNEEK